METPRERRRREEAERNAKNLAEFFEDIEWMASTGETTEGAAERRGVTTQAINKRLTKHGRTDLWDRLRANEVERFGETLGARRNRENGQAGRRAPANRWAA